MKKQLLVLLCGASLLYGGSEVSLTAGKKDYINSAKKIDGNTLNFSVAHKYEDGKISLGYLKDDVNLITNPKGDLEVKKYNAKYNHQLGEKLNLKASYIKILDNQAPTDQGKVYGLGATYKFQKGFGTKFDIYKSDYETFDVNQYDLSFFKGFKVGETKGKVTLIGKSIKIDGNKYGSYTFKDKDYFTTGVKLGLNYHGYVAGMGAFFGERIFTILDDGTKVQHHAIEQDKTYVLSLGKKFKNFDIIAKYSFQNGNELPEGRNDVDTKVTVLQVNYKF